MGRGNGFEHVRGDIRGIEILAGIGDGPILGEDIGEEGLGVECASQ